VFQSARDAVGERNPVWRARSADEAADLLISGRCGVLLIDMSAVSTRADTLIHQVTEQFPDIVICVAGSRGDEPLLAPLISDGLVYRFMHKPVSAKRAGMFLQAAIRRHAERRGNRELADPLLPLLRSLRAPSTGLPPRYMGLLAVVGALVLLPFLFDAAPPGRNSTPEPAAATGTSTPATLTEPKPQEPRANEVLSRARAALQAGRLEAPEGRNALDLFESVLLAQPDQPEARDGLRKTIELLLQRAEDETAAGRRDEAARLARRVLAVDPQQTRAQALLRKLSPSPDTPSRQLEREQAAQARRSSPSVAAATGAPPRREASSTRETAAPAPIVSASPAPSTVRPTAPPATPPQNLQPQPDPLAPRYSNANAAANSARPTGRSRAFGAPITNQHAIAGLAAPAPVASAAVPESAAVSGMTTPAAEFDRIVARDPVYPPDAFRNGVSGWVELEFTITEKGTVRDVVTVAAEPLGVFERSAIEALAAWQFRPRTVNGRPVAQRSSITLRFDVDD
jgi:protein TonB